MQARQDQSNALQTQGMFANNANNAPVASQPVQNDPAQQVQQQEQQPLTYDGKSQTTSPVTHSRFR